MNVIQALILGAIQGLTEFFPVSSSAHLTLGRWLLGIGASKDFIFFDLLCHTGTLFALLIYLRAEIWAALKSIKTIGYLFLSLLPLIPAYFLLKPLRSLVSDPNYLGYFLCLTSLLLFAASKKRPTDRDSERLKWRSVLCIGLMQTMALFPGISRSGSTIATARLLGWDWLSAARFSFLLAIPTILGGQFLETIKLFKEPALNLQTLPMSCYLVGFFTSFLVGMVGVKFIFKIYELGNVRPFAWYCLAVGLITWFIFHG
jgi:undecaprenyl-diphosphatase